METEQNTFGDRQRLAMSKFGAKSSNLNKDFERPLKTMKDSQRLAVIPNDPDIPMISKDRQRHPATANDYMEARLKRNRLLELVLQYTPLNIMFILYRVSQESY